MIIWKVLNIEYIESQEGMLNVAKNIIWYAYGTDELGNYGNTWGNTILDTEGLDPATFISWDDLTEETVLRWAHAAMRQGSENGGRDLVDDIEQNIANIMENENLTPRSFGTPW